MPIRKPVETKIGSGCEKYGKVSIAMSILWFCDL